MTGSDGAGVVRSRYDWPSWVKTQAEFDEYRAYVDLLVSEAPPFSEAKKAELRRLLRPRGGAA